jgi:phosphatidylinositol alpha 1,6-mannosyltransferase
MRIALATESFYPAVDGTTTTVKAVADRLVDTGHEVTLLAPGPGLSSYRGSRVVRSRHLDPSGSQVREALTDFGPDLVHVASPGPLGRKVLKHARRLGIAPWWPCARRQRAAYPSWPLGRAVRRT